MSSRNKIRKNYRYRIYLYRRYLTDACYAFKGWRTVQKNTAPKVKQSAECCGTPAFALNRCFSAVGTCSTAVEAKPTVKKSLFALFTL